MDSRLQATDYGLGIKHELRYMIQPGLNVLKDQQSRDYRGEFERCVLLFIYTIQNEEQKVDI